jgi:hypothetical protein
MPARTIWSGRGFPYLNSQISCLCKQCEREVRRSESFSISMERENRHFHRAPSPNPVNPRERRHPNRRLDDSAGGVTSFRRRLEPLVKLRRMAVSGGYFLSARNVPSSFQSDPRKARPTVSRMARRSASYFFGSRSIAGSTHFGNAISLVSRPQDRLAIIEPSVEHRLNPHHAVADTAGLA